jgi:signal peptidase I
MKKSRLRRLGVTFAVLIAACSLLNLTGLIKVYQMPTGSMEPTVNPGDWFITEGFSLFGEPKRGSLVAFTTAGINLIDTGREPPQIFLQRLVGLPGDELEIRQQELWINDKPQTAYFSAVVEKYITPRAGEMDLSTKFRVPSGHVFVIGDNTGNSSDSRMFGPVPEKNLKTQYLAHLYRAPRQSDLKPAFEK